mmetsp:Transcript_42353/g.88612  ORF Transcript_42353/g.88612 Transcript_42353/m.88612 type:complete len:98 (+) Transcript_42353:1578-1871(+)
MVVFTHSVLSFGGSAATSGGQCSREMIRVLARNLILYPLAGVFEVRCMTQSGACLVDAPLRRCLQLGSPFGKLGFLKSDLRPSKQSRWHLLNRAALL